MKPTAQQTDLNAKIAIAVIIAAFVAGVILIVMNANVINLA